MLKKKKILIVEDEADFAKLVKIRLQSVGYDVSLAYDTHIGTRMMMKEKWDLLVLDLMMPGGGGFALLEKVHQSPDKAKIPVIILTGKTIDNEVRMKAEAYHVSDIILKPYKSKQFVERIRKVIPN